MDSNAPLTVAITIVMLALVLASCTADQADECLVATRMWDTQCPVINTTVCPPGCQSTIASMYQACTGWEEDDGDWDADVEPATKARVELMGCSQASPPAQPSTAGTVVVAAVATACALLHL